MVSGCPCGLLHWDDYQEELLVARRKALATMP